MRASALLFHLRNTLDSGTVRLAARLGAVMLVATTVLHGAARSSAFEDDRSPWSKLPGRLASSIGLAADDIQVAGLEQHDVSEVLQALDLKPGKSLIGFDTNMARRTLETLPWLRSAGVAREYPNLLKINLTERRGIALWQHGPDIDLIDETGAAMGKPHYVVAGQLPMVTGEGANTAAAELINQMSAIPGLSNRVHAAARVGDRRWTLFLDNGVKLALPEKGAADAMKLAWNLDQTQGLWSKGISVIDLRLSGQLAVQVAAAQAADPSGDGKAK